MLYGADDIQCAKYMTDINGHEIYEGETMFIVGKKIMCRECFSYYLKNFDEESIAELTGLATVDICHPYNMQQVGY